MEAMNCVAQGLWQCRLSLRLVAAVQADLNKYRGTTFNKVEQNSINPMKTPLSLLAAVSVLSIAVPANAIVPPFPNTGVQSFANTGVQPIPGQRQIVNYLTNGTPVYAVYQIVGYDAMGYPIYQWVTLPTGSPYLRPYYGSSGYRNYGYRSYNYRPNYVRPTYVRPTYVYPGHVSHFGHVGHIGSFGHSSGPVFHGGGHMSHGGGGHVSHGGGGHVSHGGGGHAGHGGGGHHR